MRKSIWPRASSFRVDRSLAAHSVMGLVISAVLYIVCVSGTLAVFEDEFGWWERPIAPVVTEVSPAAAQRAADYVLETQPDTTHLYLYLPQSNWPRFLAGGDEGLETMSVEGSPIGPYETAWNHFLIELHYYLSLPHSFGMIIVAVFGVMLIAMSISGFLAHPKIFKDAFRLKRSGQKRLIQADLHNRLSVWTAPFHIIVAGTGAVIGLFVVVAFILAQTSFNGDTRALAEGIFGAEGEVDSSPAPMPNIAAAMEKMKEVAPDRRPMLLIVHDPGTASQHVEISAEHSERLIYSENYVFTPEGEFEGIAGYSNGEAGKQIAYSVYRLHFGDFGGALMKMAYFFLGGILCLIIASGLNIYFLKQAEKGRPMTRLASGWSGIVWGTPGLLMLTLSTSLMGANEASMTALFWLGLIATGIAGCVVNNAARVGYLLRLITGAIMVMTGLVHVALFADSLGNPYVSSCNLMLVLGGTTICCWRLIRQPRLKSVSHPQPTE